MSINVELDERRVPYLVSPYEHFLFVVDHVKLTVESGSGYPGQGGCFYGSTGKCFVSQYRVVFVSNAADPTAYRSFSLPFYGIRDWSFYSGYFGGKSWKGHVNRVPGGGLISVGTFNLVFESHGFTEFMKHTEAYLAASRPLFQKFAELQGPSVLLVPAKLNSDSHKNIRLAFCAADDPFTVFVIKSTSSAT